MTRASDALSWFWQGAATAGRLIAALLEHLHQSAAPQDVIWLVIGILGGGGGLGLLLDFHRERRVLIGDGRNGADELLNGIWLGVAWSLFAQHVAVITIGVVAVALPPANGGAARITPLTVVLTAALFVISVMALGAAGWIRVRRAALRKYLIARGKSIYLSELTNEAVVGNGAIEAEQPGEPAREG